MITQLWLADTRNWPEKSPQAWIDSLSLVEKQRLERLSLRSPPGREYLHGRTVLRHALRQNFPEVTSWELAAEGPTRVQSPTSARLGTALHVNLSHSHGWILCSLSNLGACGCDIEASPRQGNTPRIAERYFTTNEVAALNRMEKDAWNDAFLTMWTLKEAYLKARKTGISGGLARLEVLPCTDGWQAHAAPAEPGSDKHLMLYRYAETDARAGAAFFLPQPMPIKLKSFRVDFGDRLLHTHPTPNPFI